MKGCFPYQSVPHLLKSKCRVKHSVLLNPPCIAHYLVSSTENSKPFSIHPHIQLYSHRNISLHQDRIQSPHNTPAAYCIRYAPKIDELSELVIEGVAVAQYSLAYVPAIQQNRHSSLGRGLCHNVKPYRIYAVALHSPTLNATPDRIETHDRECVSIAFCIHILNTIDYAIKSCKLKLFEIGVITTITNGINNWRE